MPDSNSYFSVVEWYVDSPSLAVTVMSARQTLPETVSVIRPPRVSWESWVLNATRPKVSPIRNLTSSDRSPYLAHTASVMVSRTRAASVRPCTT